MSFTVVELFKELNVLPLPYLLKQVGMNLIALHRQKSKIDPPKVRQTESTGVYHVFSYSDDLKRDAIRFIRENQKDLVCGKRKHYKPKNKQPPKKRKRIPKGYKKVSKVS